MPLDAVQMSGAVPVLPTNVGGLNQAQVIVTPEAFRNEPLRQNQIEMGQRQNRLAQLEIDQKARDARLKKKLDQKLPRDATSLDHDILASYNAEIGGPPPIVTDSDGRQVYDMQSIRNLMANKRALEFESKGGFDKLTTFQQAAVAQLAKSGYLGAAYNRDGTVKSAEQLHDALMATPRISPKDQIAIQDSLTGYRTILGQIDDAKRLATAENVGPAVGNAAVRKWTFLKAAFGIGDDQKYQDQRQLERFTETQALDASQKLKGALSDNDIKFLRRSIITLGDTPEAWQDFLQKYESATRQAMANRMAGLHYEEGADTPIDKDGNPVENVPSPFQDNAVTPVAGGQPVQDYSQFDKRPPVIVGKTNSELIRAPIYETRTGEKRIKLDGNVYAIGDSSYNTIMKMKSEANPTQPRTSAPSPAPAPATAPRGNLQNVAPTVAPTSQRSLNLSDLDMSFAG